VSPWSAWTSCSVPECGGGTQRASRYVTTPPNHGGAPCPPLRVSQPCNTQPCTPIDCVVSAWSAWSSCSVPCGGGAQSETRTIITEPANNGAICPNLGNWRSCNVQLCGAPSCTVSSWSAWSACSAQCGAGTHTSSRTVTSSGGGSCPALSRSQSCNNGPCTQPPSSTSPTRVVLQSSTILSTLNAERSHFSLTSLQWSSTLAAQAVQSAMKCSTSIVTSGTQGKAVQAARGVSVVPTGSAFIALKSYYNCVANSCASGHTCGAFLQSVWSSARQVGCGAARCHANSPYGATSANWTLFVCLFNQKAVAGKRPFPSSHC